MPQPRRHTDIWYALGSDTCNGKIFLISHNIQIFTFPYVGEGRGVLVVAMVTFSNLPKHQNLHFSWLGGSGSCNGKIV